MTEKSSMTKRAQEQLNGLIDDFKAHEQEELKIWDKFTKHQEKVDESIVTLNHEMGEVIGELRAIKWMMGGGFLLAMILQFILK